MDGLRQKAFHKENKKPRRFDTSHGRHMTSSEALDYLARADWESAMKDVFKEAAPKFKHWKTKILEYDRDEKRAIAEAKREAQKEEKARDRQAKQEQKRLEQARMRKLKEAQRLVTKRLREAEEAARKAAQVATRRGRKGRKPAPSIEQQQAEAGQDEPQRQRPVPRPRNRGQRSTVSGATGCSSAHRADNTHDVPDPSTSRPSSESVMFPALITTQKGTMD
ncbi:hypothetical protein OE88DRAFT_1666709, partial [Heliocybe sulcata]